MKQNENNFNMNEEECDVFVVGGGPAGATVANELAIQGIKVVLLI